MSVPPARSIAPPLLALLVLWSPARAAELQLRRVTLSTAGVGCFEHEVAVSGPDTVTLDVPLDQVDDVLKSLVVLDDAGTVSGLELPGRDGRAAAFSGVPFGPDALGSPLLFLQGLVGTELEVDGTRPMRGRLLAAETVRAAAPDGRPLPDQTRVSLLTPEGLRQFVLEDAAAVRVADPALQDRIARALVATAGEVSADRRRLSLRVRGESARTLRLGYVAAAPLWKASYRLVLPGAADSGTTARLQAWATLENAGTADWRGVRVSLQHGSPVTLRQALYRSYSVVRPEVPVEQNGRPVPEVDTRATPVPPPPPAPLSAPASAPVPSGEPRPRLRAMAAMAAPEEAAPVNEAADSTVFTVPVPVDLAAGHTASLPILDRTVPARRVVLARPGQPHPFSALELRNDTGAALPPGLLTLYDGAADAAFAGDARLGAFPAGETRLVAFAEDARTALSWRGETAVSVAALSASGGVLTLDRRNRRLQRLTVAAPADQPRHLLLDLPRPPGAPDAVPAPGFPVPAAETATAWRFALDLRPGETRDLVLAVDTTRRETLSLVDDGTDLVAITGLQGVSDRARAGLGRITELRRAESAAASARDELIRQRQAVEADEERLRANLGAVSATDAVRTRLVRQLDADETRLGQLAGAIETANAAVARAHAATLAAVNALEL